MSLHQSLVRVGRWARIAVVVVCLLLAAVSALEGGAAPPGPAPGSRQVVVAAHALAAGHRLGRDDVTVVSRRERWPGALSSPRSLLGRTVAGALASGEPITALRLVATTLATGLPAGLVVLPIDLATDVRGLVTPGSRVDLLAASGSDPEYSETSPDRPIVAASRVAERVLVLAALPAGGSQPSNPTDPIAGADAAATAGCRLVLAVHRDDASRIAGAQDTTLFRVVSLPP